MKWLGTASSSASSEAAALSGPSPATIRAASPTLATARHAGEGVLLLGQGAAEEDYATRVIQVKRASGLGPQLGVDGAKRRRVDAFGDHVDSVGIEPVVQQQGLTSLVVEGDDVVQRPNIHATRRRRAPVGDQ